MRKIFMSLLCVLFIFMVACEKEDSNPAYVGTWETAIYDAINPMTSPPSMGKQKIEFTFEKDKFEALIYVGQSEGLLFNALGVRGLIENLENNTLSAELNEVGLNATGTSLVWYSKNVEEEAAIFNNYIAVVSSTIPTEFEATYKVDGDKMDLIIPAAQDTIHLFRK